MHFNVKFDISFCFSAICEAIGVFNVCFFFIFKLTGMVDSLPQGKG